MPAGELQVTDLEERLAPLRIAAVRPLAGGASSLTFTGTIAGERRVVIKVAPPGVVPTLNRDVLRQARLLRALHGTAVAVPEVLWEDPGNPPEVPPLFVMSFVEGSSLEPLFDLDGDEDEAVVAERMGNAARLLAAVHALEPEAIGLGDEPVLGLDEEIQRWSRLLETVDPALAPEWEGVASALRTCVPPAAPGAVVHGDFRLGNLLATGTDITAVVDWEIWTLGDARVDVGWFLVNADPLTYRRNTRYAASLPSTVELAEIYVEARGRDASDLEVFQALACFKSAATWSLIVKHNRRRPDPEPAVEGMARAIPNLLDRARELLA
jgi:aminoglycoside phosphotransferase (APT) family kinase protein